MHISKKISFITTVFNEEDSINDFLASLSTQSKMPDEIIIVDGGSKDDTCQKIKEVRATFKNKKTKFILLTKKGNRSVGRNEAIRNASDGIIVCTDAGNRLDKNWIKNITDPFTRKDIDVVAGYYEGRAKNVFEKCVIPYALVMPDKVNPDTFLPATRSVAFTKEIWKQVGGFNEKFSHNEDYVFARALQKVHAKIVFARDAIVYWNPRSSFTSAFIMMYRFAYGDAQARIFRPKVLFVYLRYLIGLILFVLCIKTGSPFLGSTVALILLLYVLWAIGKNYRYVSTWQAIFILSALQFVADWAVLKGTLYGLLGTKIRYN